jgi:hypothetical protein
MEEWLSGKHPFEVVGLIPIFSTCFVFRNPRFPIGEAENNWQAGFGPLKAKVRLHNLNVEFSTNSIL